MATPFAFLPRTVSKHAKAQATPIPTVETAPPIDTDTDFGSYDSDSEWSGISASPVDKGRAVEQTDVKQSTISQDIASLICLALSDYHIWVDGDLRHKLDECLSAESPDAAGFVPINYLIRRSPFCGSLSSPTDPGSSETQVVKALRAHANDTLEVRMLVSAPSSSVWYGSGKTSRKKDVGNYEVRRRDWASLLDRPSRGWSYARWDDLTVYMECVPVRYRRVAGIVRFAESLLPPPTEPYITVQNVTLPPHYLDKPGDIPKCKGYALVTFSTKSQVETILRQWPWRRRHPSSVGRESSVNTSPTVQEALKFGFRTISKARWEKLNEEYFMYKQQLIKEIARTQPSEPPRHYPDHTEDSESQAASNAEYDESCQSAPQPPTTTLTTAHTTPSSPFPFNCLVFVRNIHPETNKTTLKTLFAQAFQGEVSALDYIDFNKGMDTCYLRVASPHHATFLTEFFGERLTVQTHGLDATGRKLEEDEKKPIMMEIIQGKKEELYWDKVPEKVRRQAVEKALKAQANEPSLPPTTLPQNGSHGQKKRKRAQ